MHSLPKVCFIGLLLVAGIVSLPANATVQITSLAPSIKGPQPLGTVLTWTAVATDSNPGPLTFQFSAAVPAGPLALVKDFNVGILSGSNWFGQPFVWTPTALEGIYRINVVAKDFATGDTATKTAYYQVSALATGSTPVVVSTANPLVALFSSPSCAAGSSMRVSFQIQSGSTPATTTKYQNCHPPATMNFEIAGMYPNTTYNMFSQTATGSNVVNGPTVTFTAGALPTSITFPTFQQVIPVGPKTNITDSMVLLNSFVFGGATVYPSVAVDLTGNVMWYYYAQPPQSVVMTRPLANGTFLTFQSGAAWDPAKTHLQYLRQTDLAGNLVKETNTGILQQQLLAKGATNGGPCTGIPQPAPEGAACLDGFSHEAITTLPNGYTAVLLDTEKIYPAGTQGDTSGLPVDVVGNMIVVLDKNWQLVWYFDSFEHAGGAPELDINRAAVLGETCVPNSNGNAGCPPLSLITSGIAPNGKDWLHGNSLYYRPQDGSLIYSSRHQDWILKIDYNNGAGAGNILWRLGPCGDFTFNNINNDPWPWNSHQHDVGIELGGAGVMTIFDNGNTRVSPAGNSTGCVPGFGSGNSRGMAVSVDETNLLVTPVLSADLGHYSTADGSAQQLEDGHYYFLPAVVLVGLNQFSFSVEIAPKPGTTRGQQVLSLEGPSAYRGWRMPNLYAPPIT